MIIQLFKDGGTEYKDKEFVRDHFDDWICEGMYVNEIGSNSEQRQGWIKEVIDEEKNGTGKIKVQVIKKAGERLAEEDVYVTEFVEAHKWCKALPVR